MRKFSGLLIAVAALVLAMPPLMAQESDGHPIYFYPPIHLSNLPQNPATPVGILPSQFKAAYGFNQIPNQGQGQTIAVIDAYDDPNIALDLAVYQAQFHLGPCNFRKVTVGNPQHGSWDLETSLDVEQVCALAPRANILLVEAESQSASDLLAAVQAAYSSPNNATVVSMSFGSPDFSGEQQYDSYFCNILNGNGQPVTFVASSGDAGHHPEYPATSPCVLAAGGTTLALSQVTPLANPFQLDYGSEIGWSGSGGGVSTGEGQPSWQNPACAAWSTSNRCVPDVASVAQNIPVYCSCGGSGEWATVDGTSISSPDWAAFFTIVNSLRANQGKGPLSQAAYDVYQVYYSGGYGNNFHDITTGSNGNCGSQCNAGPAYDLVTGMGTYRANTLVNSLVADPN
ncbi:MAG: S53 family peptidase [Candidatus Korobacteraceae bacterium]